MLRFGPFDSQPVSEQGQAGNLPFAGLLQLAGGRLAKEKGPLSGLIGIRSSSPMRVPPAVLFAAGPVVKHHQCSACTMVPELCTKPCSADGAADPRSVIPA